LGKIPLPFHNKPILFVANQAMALYKFRLGAMLELQERGYEIIAIAPEDHYSEKIRCKGIRFVPLRLHTHRTNPFNDCLAFVQLFRLYARHKPCLIFHYTIKPNIYGNIAAFLAGGIPSISMVPGRGYSFHQKNWLFALVRQLYRCSLRFAREVWFLNEEDRQFFLQQKMVQAGKTAVLPGEGVNIHHYKPKAERSPAPPQQLNFLFSGRLMWEKGVKEFVEAARIVRHQYPGCRFFLLGFMDKSDHRVVPETVLKGWEQEGLITYLGEVEDVRPYFAQADCFVLPSYYGEGLPRTLLEAASMGIPLITTQHRGCNRAVVDGLNGFLCRAGDAQDLADKMLEMVRLPQQERQAMGERGRALVMAEFEEGIIVRHYLDKVESTLNGALVYQKPPLFATVQGFWYNKKQV
jgi:glycosyltransferase involved in cell wall biosynthesis